MNILVFGDVFGRKGREMVAKFLGELKDRYSPDFIIANSENMTSGMGPIPKHLEEMRALGIDAFTGGNHIFSHLSDIGPYMDAPGSVQIRPANYYEVPGYEIPGKWSVILEKNGKKILLVNLISGVFLKDQVYNPFLKADEILASCSGEKLDAVLVDFHRETTSESYCMAEYLSWRATFVYGTHTHVQTNDEHILPSGTGMITDVGMTGPLHSAIGQEFAGRLPTMVTGVSLFSSRPEQAMWDGVLNAILIQVENGKCVSLEKIRIREEKSVTV